MTRARTLAAVVLACAVACWLATPASAEDTPKTAAEAQQRVDTARAAANDAAARVDAATTEYEKVGEAIAAVEQDIERGKRRAAELKEIVRDRAVAAYTSQGGDSSDIAVLFSSDDLLAALRKVRMLDTVNARDDDAISELAALEKDLASEKQDLDQRRKEQADALQQLQRELKDVQARLADAEKAQQDLQERFAREAAAIAAKRAAEAQTRSGPAGQIINPGGGPFVCPVAGPTAFTDDFGAPRSGHTHGGIDMFAAEGTPLVAVAAGSVSFGTDPAGGNDAYVNAKGNTYFYAHLSGFAGGPRSVAQGEVIGYVGHTGDAQGPHLHFEIRVGGPNGTRIDPYPTLRQYC